ncbi:MAG: hypothetical protein CFE44_07605 [Burkholderiales bacterium PBB4]|nr:MAG: hypothetical protein CFE44_07605 [Burkholderiales bacterium PBB4]
MHGQGFGKLCDHLNNGFGIAAVERFLHKGLVDFQGVEREAAQVGQGGVAGPKVIQGNANPHSMQGVQLLQHGIGVVDKGRFGDFELQPVRG